MVGVELKAIDEKEIEGKREKFLLEELLKTLIGEQPLELYFGDGLMDGGRDEGE